MHKMHKRIYRVLNYIAHLLILHILLILLILHTYFTGCVSISAFVSLVAIPIGITSTAIVLKICVITAGIKKFKSLIKKKKKKHDKVLLATSKLNSIVVLISKALINLINSNIFHDELVLINNVLKEFYDMKEYIYIYIYIYIL